MPVRGFVFQDGSLSLGRLLEHFCLLAIRTSMRPLEPLYQCCGAIAFRGIMERKKNSFRLSRRTLTNSNFASGFEINSVAKIQ